MEIRQAKQSEIRDVQTLDAMIFEDGFRHYEELYKLNPKGILVAVDNERVVGYIAAERIAQRRLIGRIYQEPLPPWDHDPRQFNDPSGDVDYIVGHAVALEYQKIGVSDQLIKVFLESASQQRFKMVAFVYNLRHPTLRSPEEVLGKHDFRPLLDTYDPRWKHAADKPVDGCIVWCKYLYTAKMK